MQSLQKQIIQEMQLQLLRHHYPEQSEKDNKETLVALKKADNNRTLPQRILVERLRKAELVAESRQPADAVESRRRHDEIQREIERVRRQMVPPLAIRALWDIGRPSPTYILRRGEHNKPGDPVGPGVPSVLTDGRTPFVVEPPFPEGTRKTGRRLAFARWLTQDDHPLTARVMANRIWHHHFGTGLVKDLGNFGVKGDRPSHPGLLDWLATEFVKRDWSIKQMHRLIMHSRTYRQTSHIGDRQRDRDPQNRLLSRMPLRRMDAEALRDSLLFVSGKLENTPGGLPDTVTVDRDGLVSANPTDGGGWRRSVYLQYRRTEIPTMMDTFDYPQMGPNCITRSVSIVSPQSLMLMNNGRVRELATALATRVHNTVASSGKIDDASYVRMVYQIALSRSPSEQERRLGTSSLRELRIAWKGDAKKALDSYCHSILNSAAFQYVD